MVLVSEGYLKRYVTEGCRKENREMVLKACLHIQSMIRYLHIDI